MINEINQESCLQKFMQIIWSLFIMPIIVLFKVENYGLWTDKYFEVELCKSFVLGTIFIILSNFDPNFSLIR